MRTRNGAKRQEKDCDNGGQRAKKRKRVWIIFEIYTALQYITKYAEKMRENGENSQELEKYSIVYGTINYLKKIHTAKCLYGNQCILTCAQIIDSIMYRVRIAAHRHRTNKHKSFLDLFFIHFCFQCVETII